MDAPRQRDTRRVLLGEHVKKARAPRWRYKPDFAEATGLSTRSISSIELGDPVGDTVREAIENALGWPAGSIAEYLDGGPLPQPYGRRHDDTPQGEPTPDPVRARIAAMTNLELLERAAEIELTAGKACADAYVESAWEIRRRAPKHPLTTNQA
jgi:hypothetical protein